MDAMGLQSYVQAGEGLTVEFKRCGGQPGDDTFETICSFANRQGGNLFLGVEDDGTVRGVPDKAIRSIQRNLVNVVNNPKLFNVAPVVETEVIAVDGHVVIRVWVPMGPAVYTYKGVTYDRIADSDVRLVGIDQISLLYLRKQNAYSERKVYRYVGMQDFRPDLIARARGMALAKNPHHPWGEMTDEELLRSAKLYSRDRQTGEEGFTLAAILLLGTDEVIADVCPAYRTDAILRREDLDRYDDRLTLNTNLLDSYDRLYEFGTKHLPDRFALDDVQRVSARDIIVRELVVNLLIHREFISPFPAKLIVERDCIRTENASRTVYEGRITLEDFNPVSKNPVIAGFFSSIGLAEELGSGFRNLQKYSYLYSGKPPILEDGDIFRARIPTTPLAAARGIDGALEAARLLAERDGSLSSSSLAEYLGVSTRTAQRYIKVLLEEGHVVQEGAGATRAYRLP